MTVGIVVNSLRLRARAQALSNVDDRDPGRDGEPVDVDLDGWVFVTGRGVELDEATRLAAVRFATERSLDVVDLVPADLGAERVLDTLRMVDVATYRHDPLIVGRGAFQALVLSPTAASRVELDRTTDLDPVEMVALTAELKRCAPTSTDLAVGPARAAAESFAQRKAQMRAVWGGANPGVLALPAVEWALLAAGLGLDPIWGAAAIAAYAVQPAVVTAGSPAGLRPRDLSRSAARPGREPWRWLQTIRSSWRSPTERDLRTELRPVYASLLAEGTDRFFEPRRDDCPWCGGTALTERVRVRDRLQHKPGEFVMDECVGCGLVFQNPRLTIEGLDFYYRDFYDGLGADQLDLVFGTSAAAYTGRADLVKGYGQPKRWLDVGTGHGHFCLIAKASLPDTVFDGLDMGDSIDDAERRGWVDRGYRGLFPELADELVGTYDVVSMHHYLEHVRDPFAEIDAAERVLTPGGHLLIEVPDPESRWARVLGSTWMPWFQPQHQQMVPIGTLVQSLEERGWTVLAEDRVTENQPMELLAASFFGLDSLAPDPRLPWGPEFSWARWGKRAATIFAMVPTFVVTVTADRLFGRVIEAPGQSNAYRVLARKQP
jgi:SAM-dependent methyltransferase